MKELKVYGADEVYYALCRIVVNNSTISLFPMLLFVQHTIAYSPILFVQDQEHDD